MTQLVKYEAARAALQAAHDVDEVKNIRDKAQAMAAYARQAQDDAMLLWASEIKVRAERRAGEMLSEMPKNHGARGYGKKVEPTRTTPLLSELGISKDQSSKWQKVAAIPEETFERVVKEAKELTGFVTTANLLARSITRNDSGERRRTRADIWKRALDAEQSSPLSKFPLWNGVLLRDATYEDIRTSAEDYYQLADDMHRKGVWLARVAARVKEKGMPDEATLRAVLQSVSS